MKDPQRALQVLDERIDARSKATREEHPWWPCARGCDHCCRSLPHLPTITGAEWERLARGLARLPDDVRAEVERRLDDAPEAGPLVCPMLDRAVGACLVYADRPIACRTYGFYTERDGGLHCGKVTAAVTENGASESVLWGNGAGVTDDLRGLGEVQSVRYWRASR